MSANAHHARTRTLCAHLVGRDVLGAPRPRDAIGTPTGTRAFPAGADAAHPVPVFLFGDHCGGDRPPAYEQKEYADIPTSAITARGYAYVRWNFNDVCPNASRWSKTLFRWPVGIVSHVATGDRAAKNVVRTADG